MNEQAVKSALLPIWSYFESVLFGFENIVKDYTPNSHDNYVMEII